MPPWTSQAETYLYDGEGRLCAVNAGTGSYTEYVYDALGARVAKGTLSVWPASCVAPTSANGFTVTAQYLLGLGGEQVTELNDSATWVHTNVWAGARLTATYDTARLHFNLADPLGTRRVQASAITEMAELDCLGLAWGNNIGNTLTTQCVAMQPGATDDTEHHFTGKERDTESGNDYFEARYYSSMQGRFMSPDWSAKVEPVPYAKLDDPQSLNLYVYVRDNPLILVDADGHMWDEFQGVGCDGIQQDQCRPQGLDKASAELAAQNQAQQQNQSTDESQNAMFFAKGSQGKGERGHAGNRHGSGDEDKHVRPDPNKPGNILVKDPHTGKTVSVPDPKARPAVPEPERAGRPGKKSMYEQVNDWLNEHLPDSVKQYLRDHPYGPNSSPGPYAPPVIPTPIPVIP